MGAVQPDCCHYTIHIPELRTHEMEGLSPIKGSTYIPLGSCRDGCTHTYGRDWLLLLSQVLVVG